MGQLYGSRWGERLQPFGFYFINPSTYYCPFVVPWKVPFSKCALKRKRPAEGPCIGVKRLACSTILHCFRVSYDFLQEPMSRGVQLRFDRK